MSLIDAQQEYYRQFLQNCSLNLQGYFAAINQYVYGHYHYYTGLPKAGLLTKDSYQVIKAFFSYAESQNNVTVVPFALSTGCDDVLNSDPWNVDCANAEEYAFTLLGFSIETDEREIVAEDLDPEELETARQSCIDCGLSYEEFLNSLNTWYEINPPLRDKGEDS